MGAFHGRPGAAVAWLYKDFRFVLVIRMCGAEQAVAQWRAWAMDIHENR